MKYRFTLSMELDSSVTLPEIEASGSPQELDAILDSLPAPFKDEAAPPHFGTLVIKRIGD